MRVMTRTIELTEKEENKLEKLRDTHPKPHIRERAAAVLKVANGMSGKEVAKEGLLKERKTDTVYNWLNQWEENGLDGLTIEEGRGRNPKHEFTEKEKKELQEIVHQSPENFGIEKSRWTVKDIQQVYEPLQSYTESGAWRVLNRLGIVYKRGKKEDSQS